MRGQRPGLGGEVVSELRTTDPESRDETVAKLTATFGVRKGYQLADCGPDDRKTKIWTPGSSYNDLHRIHSMGHLDVGFFFRVEHSMEWGAGDSKIEKNGGDA